MWMPAVASRLPADQLLCRPVVRGGKHQQGLRDIIRGVCFPPPVDFSLAGKQVQFRLHLRADHPDPGPRGKQSLDLAQGHLPAADHHAQFVLDVEADGIHGRD